MTGRIYSTGEVIYPFLRDDGTTINFRISKYGSTLVAVETEKPKITNWKKELEG